MIGGESITIVLLISGGNAAKIHTPLIVFSDQSRRYPLPGLLDNHLGKKVYYLSCFIFALDVTYRSQPKGWIDGEVFAEWLAEDRVFPRHVEHERHIFLDNCSSHKTTQRVAEILEMKNIRLHYLPPNSTSLCQPLDSGLIKVVRDVWKRQWNERKDEFIQLQGLSGVTTRSRSWSRNIDTSKKFFLRLVASVIQEVNSMQSRNGQNLSHDAMVKCGLGVDHRQTWTKTMLLPRLREIVDAYPTEFHGSQSSA